MKKIPTDPLAVKSLSYKVFLNRLKAKLEAGQRLPLCGQVELTYRCNFRCVHCYQREVPPVRELDTKGWFRVLDQVAEAGCIYLTLTGGDPLVRKDFEDIYCYAIKKGFLVSLFCNGSLVTEGKADLIAEYPPRHVEVSLYGTTPETYEAVTGVAGGYKKTVDGIERLAKRGIPVHLKTALLKETVSELNTMESFAASLGLSFRFDSFVHAGMNNDKTPTHHRLPPEKSVAQEATYPDFLEKLCGEREKLGPRVENKTKLYRCGAGRWFFGVDPEGNLRICPTIVDPVFSLSKVSFNKAWEIFGQELERTFGDSPCAECTVIDLCSRCPGIATIEVGDPCGASLHFGEIAEYRAQLVGRKDRAHCLARAQVVAKRMVLPGEKRS
ncbi:MAG: radical SAM protein [Pseudomonadota bacterium]